MSPPALTRPGTGAAVVLAALLVVAAGCGNSSSISEADAGEDGPLDGGTWMLTEGSVDGARFTSPEGSRISLTVEGDKAGGMITCNYWGAIVEINGDRVSFSKLSSTDAGCGGDSEEARDRFLDAVPRVTTATREGDALELTGAGVSLSFRRNPPVPVDALVGPTWQLETLIHDGTATPADAAATLRLDDDGTLTATTGCRELTGDYNVFGDHITFSNFGAANVGRRRDCPPALEEQHEHVRDVFEPGFRVQIDNDRLEVMSRQGNKALGYRAQ